MVNNNAMFLYLISADLQSVEFETLYLTSMWFVVDAHLF